MHLGPNNDKKSHMVLVAHQESKAVKNIHFTLYTFVSLLENGFKTCVYVSVCVFTCIYVCVCASVSVCACVCVHTCFCVCVCVGGACKQGCILKRVTDE